MRSLIHIHNSYYTADSKVIKKIKRKIKMKLNGHMPRIKFTQRNKGELEAFITHTIREQGKSKTT